jgi:glutathione S-transferase
VRFADGVRIQGSRNLSRALDVLYPQRPLFPAERRREVERAEHWGDLVLQEVPRRLAWWGLRRRPEAVGTFLVDAKLGVPPQLVSPLTGPVVVLAKKLNRATDSAVERDLAALPGLLDHVDGLIADGVIGGDEPTAADLQIGSTLRVLLCVGDVRPLIEGRPAEQLARRWFPDYAGDIPAGAFPRSWSPA